MTHPQNPLTDVDIRKAVEIVLRDAGLDKSAWFETISLDESQTHKTGNRHAYICCYEPSSNRTFSGTVSLAAGSLDTWQHIDGAQARIVPDEFVLACELARKDPAFTDALKNRGIDDPSKVLIESWAAGNFGDPEEEGLRIAYGHCWLINDAGDNPYARPIANLHPVFDLAARKILRIDDYGVVPIPPDPGPVHRKEQRVDVKELEITQPDGPSFTVDGYNVRWQNWQIRVGYNTREGLTLHDIAYSDHGRIRPIMRRASMAEMVVPYGDPGDANYRRNAFDTGEYGIGASLDSLALGCDCLGHIHYFDAWTHDWHGEPWFIKNAICMHEEDHGILWKFSYWDKGHTAVTRSRRLVISSIATIGNYIYGFYWYFYQDGTIGVEIKATGIPFPTAIAPGKESQYGTIVAPGVESHVHQHVFSFRFDMTIDGDQNSVKEINFAAAPMDADNPHGNAITTHETLFQSELEAQRELNMASSRYWKVINPETRNALGQSTGYKLVPGVNALPFQHPDSSVGRRAGFMYKHLWVTQNAPDELYPAGWFPNQHPGGDGLPKWTKADRPGRQSGYRGMVHYELSSSSEARRLACATGRLCRLPLDAIRVFR